MVFEMVCASIALILGLVSFVFLGHEIAGALLILIAFIVAQTARIIAEINKNKK